jgi:hypothetical protein
MFETDSSLPSSFITNAFVHDLLYTILAKVNIIYLEFGCISRKYHTV